MTIHAPLVAQTVGKRAAAATLALAYGWNNTPYLNPTYSSASVTSVLTHSGGARATIGITVSFVPNTVGRFGLALNTSVTCPPTVPWIVCEAFAVQTSDSAWHNTTNPSLSADKTQLLLSVDVAAGLTAVATRGMFADWPIAQLHSADGNFPVLPWLAPIAGMKDE
jgi:hypothetical protein